MILEILIVNAFTHDGTGGNPAGVVLDANELTSSEKQYIAKVVGLSETAFVSESKTGTYKVDFFTPTDQVAMCGHATIATWSALKSRKHLLNGKHTQELINGVLGIELLEDGSVVMEQKLPDYGQTVSPSDLSALLDLDITDFLSSPLPQFVSTGMFDLMVGVKDSECLNKVTPNLLGISEFQKNNNGAGLHLFTLLTENTSKAVAKMRDFCPLLGIPEESATGSATGALLCYLYKNNLLSEKQVTEGIWFEQGYSMGQPSDIFGKLALDNDKKIKKVEIGGKATIVSVKKISQQGLRLATII